MTDIAQPPAFDTGRLDRFLRGRLPGLGGEMAIERIAGGQSNPTFFVTCGDRRLVLRKKPDGPVLPSAHAVDREYRVLTALGETAVPVPRTILYEEDEAIVGTPFYLMERLEGQVSEDSALPGLTPAQRGAVYGDAARTLACLHNVDWRAAGLEDFGRHEDYYRRQVRRWSRQWTESKTREDAEIDALSDWFADNTPADSGTCIVHGDYRIGNLMFGPSGDGIVGVLDWELSTLGDPLSDLAHLAMFWTLGPDQLGGIAGLPLEALGLPTAQAFLDAYRRAGGSEAPLTPFHRAFAFYRMSVIFEGITARARAGQAASADALQVGALAPACARIATDILSTDQQL